MEAPQKSHILLRFTALGIIHAYSKVLVTYILHLLGYQGVLALLLGGAGVAFARELIDTTLTRNIQCLSPPSLFFISPYLYTDTNADTTLRTLQNGGKSLENCHIQHPHTKWWYMKGICIIAMYKLCTLIGGKELLKFMQLKSLHTVHFCRLNQILISQCILN